MKKRVLAFLLCAVMLFSLVPAALAEEAPAAEAAQIIAEAPAERKLAKAVQEQPAAPEAEPVEAAPEEALAVFGDGTAFFDPCDGSGVIENPIEEAPAEYVSGETEDDAGNVFAGWFTQKIGGEEATAPFTEGETYYGHWMSADGVQILPASLTVKEDGVYLPDELDPMSPEKLAIYGVAFTAPADEDPAILTLTGATLQDITVTGTYLEIACAADSSITAPEGVSCAVDAQGYDLTFSGEGSLTVTGGAVTEETNAESCAVAATDVTIDASMLIFVGGNAAAAETAGSYALKAENLTVLGGELDCTSGDASTTVPAGEATSRPVFITGIFSLTDGKLVLQSGEASGTGLPTITTETSYIESIDEECKEHLLLKTDGEETLESKEFSDVTFVKGYPVTVADGITGGTITPAAPLAEEGKAVFFDVAPNEGMRLSLGSIQVSYFDGTRVQSLRVMQTTVVGTYAITEMPAYRISITARFEEDTPYTTPYVFDFSDRPEMYGWTIIDGNEDGYTWEYYKGATSRTGYIGSRSYLNDTTEAIQADEWAITPAITLSADKQITLTWHEWATSAWGDVYDVYVGTENDISAMTKMQTYAMQGEGASYELTRTLNLSAYAGKTVYIAFHHDFYDGYYLFIDTVSVTAAEKPSPTPVPVGGGSIENVVLVRLAVDGEFTSVNVTVGSKIGDITAPKKEGYTFKAWYYDKDFKHPANNSTIVSPGLVLYARFEKNKEEEKKDETPAAATTIVLTIGQAVSSVNGEDVENDVAPVIRNNRTMLPARFIVEALGGEIDWDEENRIVTITMDDATIEITIGESVALVDGEEVELDSPAFIENNRTYLPLRFIAENLGATVEWDADARQVTIAK